MADADFAARGGTAGSIDVDHCARQGTRCFISLLLSAGRGPTGRIDPAGLPEIYAFIVRGTNTLRRQRNNAWVNGGESMLGKVSYAARIAILSVSGYLALIPHPSLAADATQGRQIAEARCAPCHVVRPHAREELANSPAFDVIARKYGTDADMIAHAILTPHKGMNLALSPAEAADLAAYIASLGR